MILKMFFGENIGVFDPAWAPNLYYNNKFRYNKLKKYANPQIRKCAYLLALRFKSYPGSWSDVFIFENVPTDSCLNAKQPFPCISFFRLLFFWCLKTFDIQFVFKTIAQKRKIKCHRGQAEIGRDKRPEKYKIKRNKKYPRSNTLNAKDDTYINVYSRQHWGTNRTMSKEQKNVSKLSRSKHSTDCFQNVSTTLFLSTYEFGPWMYVCTFLFYL
jgi:hypothetical protein